MKIAALRPTRFHESALKSLNSAVENHSTCGKIGYTAVAILTGSLATVELGADVLLSLGRRALCLKNETPVTTKMQSLFKQSMGVLLSVLSPIFGCKYNISYQLNKSPDVPKTEKVAEEIVSEPKKFKIEKLFLKDLDRGYEKQLTIPDYIMKELPTEETYLFTIVTVMGRVDNPAYENGWPGMIRAVKEKLKKPDAENAPVLVLFLHPHLISISVTWLTNYHDDIQSLQREGWIRGVLEISNDGPGGFKTPYSFWDPEKENKKSLANLKATLANGKG